MRERQRADEASLLANAVSVAHSDVAENSHSHVSCLSLPLSLSLSRLIPEHGSIESIGRSLGLVRRSAERADAELARNTVARGAHEQLEWQWRASQ